MTQQNSQFIETFKEEALELLGKLEEQLLELEEQPDNPEILSAVFRAMHTIKGSAAMFGLDRISTFAHEVESILSALRDGKISFSRALIGNTLIARDMILGMLERVEDGTGGMTAELTVFLEEFRRESGYDRTLRTPVGKSEPTGAIPEPLARLNTMQTWHITFKPREGMLLRGLNPYKLIEELCAMGDSSCIPELGAVPPNEELTEDCCRTGWEIILTTAMDENAIRDVFIFAEGDCELQVENVTEMNERLGTETAKLGELLVSSGKIDRESLNLALGSQKKLGEELLARKLVTPTDITVALEEQKRLQKAQAERKNRSELDTIRVKSEKLDDLMALVGELVTVHALISETAKQISREDGLSSAIEQFGRLMDDLRNNTMSIRMVPVGSTFSSFKRLVRDLSAELGKQIELVTAGGETELDKSVIEKLHDPLIHIIRNSLDHGIESPDIRTARGKPATGTIRLEAIQSGASVHIIVTDDGNGLDRGKIKEKAIAKKLIKSDDQLDDDQLLRLILLPGFSTKATANAISGRGVGMDVVNRQMEQIGGTLRLESAETVGTSITLVIPLTLAIIDGLLVRAGDEHFVIPLSSVTACMEHRSQGTPRNGVAVYHGRLLPYIDLRTFFDIPGPAPDLAQIVVVTVKEKQYGIFVDQVLGGSQAVIKPLGAIYRNVKGISSATIRGNGSIALIIDVEQIVVAANADREG